MMAIFLAFCTGVLCGLMGAGVLLGLVAFAWADDTHESDYAAD